MLGQVSWDGILPSWRAASGIRAADARLVGRCWIALRRPVHELPIALRSLSQLPIHRGGSRELSVGTCWKGRLALHILWRRLLLTIRRRRLGKLLGLLALLPVLRRRDCRRCSKLSLRRLRVLSVGRGLGWLTIWGLSCLGLLAKGTHGLQWLALSALHRLRLLSVGDPWLGSVEGLLTIWLPVHGWRGSGSAGVGTRGWCLDLGHVGAQLGLESGDGGAKA